jgi:hypothetical protein
MWWRKKKVSGTEQWTDHVAMKVLKGYRYLQRCWVCFMERVVHKWSIRKQKIVLIVVFVPVAIYCVAIVYEGVQGKGAGVSIEKIETGDHIGSPKIDTTKIKR